jgi:hypothetical protein
MADELEERRKNLAKTCTNIENSCTRRYYAKTNEAHILMGKEEARESWGFWVMAGQYAMAIGALLGVQALRVPTVMSVPLKFMYDHFAGPEPYHIQRTEAYDRTDEYEQLRQRLYIFRTFILPGSRVEEATSRVEQYLYDYQAIKSPDMTFSE